jgi:cytochrome c oxidase assembly factor CtaG
VAGQAVIAGGYSGPAALTAARALTSWTLDPLVLLAVLLACGLYLAGLRRVRARGERWPAARAVAFIAGGAGTVAVATMSFLGVYQAVLFWPRAVQTVLLLLVAPLLLALGRPLSLLAAAWPGPGRRVLAVVGSRAARVLTFPAVTALVLVTVPFVFYFSPWYRAGLTGGAVRELTYLALLAPGLVFFWTLLRVDPVPKAYPYLVSLWVTGAEVVGDAVLGLAVLADQHLIAGGYYRALGRPWGPALKTDQVLGGGALWLIGDLVGLPFLAALLIQMMREDEREAARVDTELDAAPAATAAAGAAVVSARPAGGPDATGAGPGAAVTPPAGRPWWEDDPRFTDRFRRPDGQ